MENKFIRFIVLIIGCLIIGLTINLFIIPNRLIMFGTNGISLLNYYINNVSPALNILILNSIILLTSSLLVKFSKVKKYIASSLLVPLFVYLTRDVSSYITIDLPEMLLVVIVCGFLLGYAYSMIYRQGFGAGTIFLLEDTIGTITHLPSKVYSWLIDVLVLILFAFTEDSLHAVYSLLLIIFAKEMIKVARFRLNDSKMFYVITSKEKEVKDLILRNIKSELSLLDVKGGFSKKQNKIIITVISKNDYFRLKEGIKVIDPKAFIVITDTYDVINRKSF